MKRVDYCIYFVFALLGPHFANAGWVCAEDGQEIPGAPDSVQIIDDHEIPTNCTYDGFAVSDGYYFEVKAGNSYSDVMVAVGVATEPASAGVSLKGLFYNDKLLDGNGKTLQEHFGDEVNPKRNNELSTVGVLVKKNEGGVTLYLLHDRVPLGPALHISKQHSFLYPAVLASGEATIQFLPTPTTELPDKPEERSGNIISNFFEVTSIAGETETIHCSNERIRLWPVTGHELKTKYNDDSHLFSFYVSFIEGDAENEVGYLSKNDERDPKWEWEDIERVPSAQRSACLKFVQSVFEKCDSFTLKDSTITASSSETGKSFVAEKSDFPTVTQDDF